MTNFQAVLTSTKFDIDCRNVLRFDNREAQEEYFNVASLFSNAVSINFNAGSLMETTIIYRVPENVGLNDLMSSNYCIIKDNNANATLKYYYYYVKNIIQDSGNQLKVLLELDVFQTYYIDVEFSDCEILKAHLNRFVDNGNGTVSFDGRVESKLFSNELFSNIAKRLTKRQKVSLYNSDNAEIDAWLEQHVYGWLYVYLDATTDGYTLAQSAENGTSQTNKNKLPPIYYKSQYPGGENLNGGIACICVPLTDSSTIQLNGNISWNYEGLIQFLETNGYSYVLGIKISALPPFHYYEDYGGQVYSAELINLGSSQFPIIVLRFDMFDYSETMSSNILEPGALNRVQSTFAFFTTRRTAATSYGVCCVLYQTPYIKTKPVQLSDVITFSKEEIKQANRDAKYNPKMLNSNYKEIRIRTSNSDGFVYDLQKLNNTQIVLKYYEPLTPDITRHYLCIENLDGVYIADTNFNYTGDIDTFDASLTFATSAYQDMLAHNKNFYLQNSIRRESNFAKNIFNGLKAVFSGDLSGAVEKLTGGGIDREIDRKNQELTVDNMMHAPGAQDIAKGSAVLSYMVQALGIYIEEYDILPNERDMINEQMCLFGYALNRIGNVKDYDNIRIYYNYIQAEIQETSGINISKVVHDKFKEIFARGVRFWNVDTFSYEKENYERWLGNE